MLIYRDLLINSHYCRRNAWCHDPNMVRVGCDV